MDADVNDSHGLRFDEIGEIAEELAARAEYRKTAMSAGPPSGAFLNRRLAALQGKIIDSEDD